jgi:hypothetical protein
VFAPQDLRESQDHLLTGCISLKYRSIECHDDAGHGTSSASHTGGGDHITAADEWSLNLLQLFSEYCRRGQSVKLGSFDAGSINQVMVVKGAW